MDTCPVNFPEPDANRATEALISAQSPVGPSNAHHSQLTCAVRRGASNSDHDGGGTDQISHNGNKSPKQCLPSVRARACRPDLVQGAFGPHSPPSAPVRHPISISSERPLASRPPPARGLSSRQSTGLDRSRGAVRYRIGACVYIHIQNRRAARRYVHGYHSTTRNAQGTGDSEARGALASSTHTHAGPRALDHLASFAPRDHLPRYPYSHRPRDRHHLHAPRTTISLHHTVPESNPLLTALKMMGRDHGKVVPNRAPCTGVPNRDPNDVRKNATPIRSLSQRQPTPIERRKLTRTNAPDLALIRGQRRDRWREEGNDCTRTNANIQKRQQIQNEKRRHAYAHAPVKNP